MDFTSFPWRAGKGKAMGTMLSVGEKRLRLANSRKKNTVLTRIAVSQRIASGRTKEHALGEQKLEKSGVFFRTRSQFCSLRVLFWKHLKGLRSTVRRTVRSLKAKTKHMAARK